MWRIDTLVKVAEGVYQNCPKDESRELMQVPQFVKTMLGKGWAGEKSGQGFYKKKKGDDGKSEILSLNVKTFEYAPRRAAKFASVDEAKRADGLVPRLQSLHNGKDKAAQFVRKLNYHIFSYVSHRVPEIADYLYQVDEAIKAGFGTGIEQAQARAAHDFNVITWRALHVAVGVQLKYFLLGFKK